MVDVSDDWDMAAARAKFAAKLAPGKAARKGRQKHLNGSVDGRSLRATGRTEHLNFRASPQIVEALDKHILKGKRSLWLEEAIMAKLREEGVQFENA